MDHENERAVQYASQPEYAIAALLQMLVRYPMTWCEPLGESISAHFEDIAQGSTLLAPGARSRQPCRRRMEGDARDAGRSETPAAEVRVIAAGVSCPGRSNTVSTR